MISKVELYLDEMWQDVTSYLQRNDVVLQDRSDDAFATGTLQLRYNRDTNIPPYTLLRINGNELWFAKSTCRRYLTKENYYIHNVDLLELTAILSCYILGSKNFSVTGTHRKDYEKLDIISKLMKEKYNVNFIYSDYSILCKEQEFTFGPGTTIYDALLEITHSYKKVKVKVASFNPTKNEYLIKFSLADTIYDINEEYVLDEYYSQDSETYGAILESEMTNVIDRTNTIKVSDITLRSNEYHMTADNCCLMLPTRCEEVVDFGLNSSIAQFTCNITLSTSYTNIIKGKGISASENVETTKTFEEWQSIIQVERSKNINGIDIIYMYSPLDEALRLIVENCGIEEEVLTKGLWSLCYFGPVVGHGPYYVLYPYEENPATGTSISQRAFRNLPVTWSLKDRILPKEKWDLLEDREKPKYVYYESGSNRIDGMNSYYANDSIWNKILGNSLGPFLSYKASNGSIKETLDDANGSSTGGTEVKAEFFFKLGDLENQFASIHYSYWIEYYPIVDPMVSHTKKIIPINEAKQKDLARSYEKSSNFVDFDRMIESLELTNSMMGLPEYTIEYKLNGLMDVPRAFQKINRNGKAWIIASVVRTSSLKKEVVVLNLVSTYNKVADSIGVKTQYNATKNPLNNIIDRPILWEINSASMITFPKECWGRITIDGKVLYKRVALLEHNNIVYAYIEALDQYCFDQQAVPVDSSELSTNFYCNAIPYVDSHNEAIEAQIDLGTLPPITKNESLHMPIYDGNSFKQLVVSKTKMIYKDARERIIFCLKISNCKIVDSLT